MGIERLGEQIADKAAQRAVKVARPGFWRGLAERIGLAKPEVSLLTRDAVAVSQKVARGGEAVAAIVHDLRSPEHLPVLFNTRHFQFLEKNAQQANSPSCWLKGEAGERAMFKEPRHPGPRGHVNPEAGNERLGATFGLRLGLPVNQVQLGEFSGKAGSLHYDVGQPGNPSVQFMRIAPEFGMEKLMQRGHAPYRFMSTYERPDAPAHWNKLQQYFSNPEIWDRTDFFDRTINNLRHGENYLLTQDGGKFKVHLIDNGGGFDGRIYDGKIPPLGKELDLYRSYLESLLDPQRSIYLSNILPDLKRVAAIPPEALKADVAEIPDKFLPKAYGTAALERLLQKQKMVRAFLTRIGK